MRAAQRVQDQHLLPRRAAEGEGDGRVAAAVAGAGGHQADLKPYPLADYLKLYAGKPDFAKANGLGLMVYGWGADWPDGYGFLAQIVDSRVIRATGGNSNLSVKDPAVDALLDKALTTTDTAAREQIWVDIDKKVMDDAFVLPGIWAKGLLYRPKNLTNVFITDGFQDVRLRRAGHHPEVGEGVTPPAAHRPRAGRRTSCSSTSSGGSSPR